MVGTEEDPKQRSGDREKSRLARDLQHLHPTRQPWRCGVNHDRHGKLHGFFARYASVALGDEPTKLAEFYDQSFLAAGPKGGAAFKNDESFLAWLRDLRAFNVKTGMTSMDVREVRESPIGAGYSLVGVDWAATFRRTGSTPIAFTISYLLHDADDALKVAAYISHEDQEEVMRAHGLL
jgi:hypothetical protein